MTLVDVFALAITVSMAFLSARYPRGLVWIAAIAVDYFLSTNYWRTGMGEPVLFAGLCDAAVCIAVLFTGTRMWEMWLCTAMLTSVLANFIFAALIWQGMDAGYHEAYSFVVECISVSALLLIGFTGSQERRGKEDAVAFHSWRTVFGVKRPTWFQGL
jgi:hypothetical protein